MIFNSITGDTLVTDLESRAFKGGWGFTNLVGGVDQVRDIDRAVLLKKCVRSCSAPPRFFFDA